MASRSKLSQTHTNNRPQSKSIASKPKTNLKTQSTFLNSYNSSSKQKIDNGKAAKVIYKMEKNLDHLKKVCNIPNKPQPTVSSKEMMAVAQLQSYYTLIHGKSTDNIQKLYKFYREHFIPNGSSSSSGGSSTCRINKRKTVQDLRINESPLKNNDVGKGMKSRRGSEASKINKKQIVEKEEKYRIKTELSNKNLKGFILQENKNVNKSSTKNINTKLEIDIKSNNESKQKQKQKSNKKKIKSILKKPSFDLSPNKQIKIKSVRGSIPIIFTKLYQNQKADKFSSSRSKQTFKSPRHNPNTNLKTSQPTKSSQLFLTNKTLSQECEKSLSKSSKRGTQISKYKLLKKSQNYKLNDLLDDINQLSPISDHPPPSLRLKQYK